MIQVLYTQNPAGSWADNTVPKTLDWTILSSLPLELESVDSHWAVPGGLSIYLARRVLALACCG